MPLLHAGFVQTGTSWPEEHTNSYFHHLYWLWNLCYFSCYHIADVSFFSVRIYFGAHQSLLFSLKNFLNFLTFFIKLCLCRKLLRDIPAKILVQLCSSLLFLNLVFLLDSWLASHNNTGLCICTAFFLHYFLLTSFTWAGLEALHMYLSIVRVFTPYLSQYMLKFTLMGWGRNLQTFTWWSIINFSLYQYFKYVHKFPLINLGFFAGIPLIIVIIVISVDKNNYGLINYGKHTNDTSDNLWVNF